MISLEIPAILLQHDAQQGFLRASWRSGHVLEHFQPALRQIMAYSQQHNVQHWLINIDQLPPLGTLDQQWILTEWFPSMTSTPVQHLALVLPPDLHNQMVAMAPVDEPNLEMSFALHFFTDDASAFDWLMGDAPNRAQLWDEWEEALIKLERRNSPDCAGTSDFLAVP